MYLDHFLSSRWVDTNRWLKSGSSKATSTEGKWKYTVYRGGEYERTTMNRWILLWRGKNSLCRVIKMQWPIILNLVEPSQCPLRRTCHRNTYPKDTLPMANWIITLFYPILHSLHCHSESLQHLSSIWSSQMKSNHLLFFISMPGTYHLAKRIAWRNFTSLTHHLGMWLACISFHHSQVRGHNNTLTFM